MLLLSAIPHHHDKDGNHCFEIDHFVLDSDEHHTHQHDHADTHDHTTKSSENTSCILHANFIIRQSDTNFRIKSISLNFEDDKDFVTHLSISALEHLNIILPDKTDKIRVYIKYLNSTENASPLGLRAPPITFV